MPNTDDFKNELYAMMHEAFRSGKSSVDITSGDLHRRVGDYPDAQKHRMPSCCDVMRAAMAVDAGDRIINEPPSGQGATLTIRYILPRPA